MINIDMTLSPERRTAHMVADRTRRFLAKLGSELAEAGKGRQADEVWSWRGTPRMGPQGLLVENHA